MSLRRVCGVLIVAAMVAVSTVGCEGVRTRLYLNKGNELYTAQRYEDAIQEYKKVLQIDSNNWMANYLVAMSYVALYRPGSTHEKDLEYSNNGIEALEKLLTLKAPSPEERDKVRTYYLSMLTAADRKDKAIAFLEKELDQDPNNLGLMSQIAKMYQDSGDFPNALKYHERRAALEPDNKETWYTIGVLCWARSYHGGIMVSQEERDEVVAKGLEALNKALEIDPDYFEALSYTNLLYREKMKALAAVGQLVEANEAYQTAEEYLKRALEARKKGEPAKGQT